MAKGIYVGVGGVARKAKKVYVGVEGVARKVKKVYVGIGGVARLCYNSGVNLLLSASMGVARQQGDKTDAAAAGTAYALAVGGRQDGIIEAYNDSLIRTDGPVDKWPSFGYSMMDVATVTIAGYALLVDGVMWGRWPASDNCYTIDYARVISSSLVKTDLRVGDSQRGRCRAKGASNGTIAVIGGGYRYWHGNDSNGNNIVLVDDFNDIDIYNTSLTRIVYQNGANYMNVQYGITTVGLTGPIIRFGGTRENDVSNSYIGVINSNGTGTFISNSGGTDYRESMGAACNDTYAIFGGGRSRYGGTWTENIPLAMAFNAALTRFNIADLSVGRAYITVGASAPNYAVLAGGNGLSNVMDAYDKNLVRNNESVLPIASEEDYLTAARFGNKILFTDTLTNTVHLYDA